jgi:hypothetical protein
MGVKSTVTMAMAPRFTGMAPGLTTRFVRDAMHHAVTGVGPLTGAAEGADKQLKEQRGDVERAVHEVIEFHVRLAGAGGFVTNLGGVVSAAVTIPVNITELALIQCRMIAGIAHLRGYDLADPRVRNAILATMMGEDTVEDLVKRKRLPARPMALATATEIYPDLDRLIANEVASDLIKRVAGKRTAVVVARRVPIVGGMVGAGADGFATWQLGRYADRELRPLARR